jgi:SAM-dependent methyltransferase
MLDVACGQGRHMAWFKSLGLNPTGIDRSHQALQAASAHGHVLEADIESGPWPLMNGTAVQRFDVVVVTNYLWRPLLPTIVDSVAPGGWLIYETFAVGNEVFGKPSNPDFLLHPGELLQACHGLDVLAYEHGLLHAPDRCVQRIAACKPSAGMLPSASQALWLE